MLKRNEAASVEAVTIARSESRLAAATNERVIGSDAETKDPRVQVPQRASLDGGTLLGVKADGAHLLGRQGADKLKRDEQRFVRGRGLRCTRDMRSDARRDMCKRSRTAVAKTGATGQYKTPKAEGSGEMTRTHS